MRISDWSSDVCSSDLIGHHQPGAVGDIGDLRAVRRPGRLGILRAAFRQQRQFARSQIEEMDRLTDLASIRRRGDHAAAGRQARLAMIHDARAVLFPECGVREWWEKESRSGDNLWEDS